MPTKVEVVPRCPNLRCKDTKNGDMAKRIDIEKVRRMQEEIDELRECIRYIFGETLKVREDIDDAPKWSGKYTQDLPVQTLIGFVRLAHKYRPQFMQRWIGHMERWERQGKGCFAFVARPTCKCLQYLRPTSPRQNQSCCPCRELPLRCPMCSRCALCGKRQCLKECEDTDTSCQRICNNCPYNGCIAHIAPP